MKVLIKQKNKDLFSANFDIIENGEIIGNLYLKGHISTPEVKLTGKIYNKEFYMERAGRAKGKFRPYSISENNIVVGEVYQAEVRKGWFSRKAYTKCTYNGQEYNSYGVAVKDGKAISAIFSNEKQIAQCENDTTIHDELYNFEIYCNTQEEAFISVLTAISRYIIGFYKAGEKVTQSVRKFYSSKSDWEDKYDSSWVNKLK